MKTTLLGLLTLLIISFSATIFAAVVEVPIVVKDDNTYVVGEGTVVPTSGDYYYVYGGHRCYPTEQTTYSVAGTTVTTTNGPSLYCYPTP